MKRVFFYMGVWFLALVLCLSELQCNAQVWPDSGCVDHPYTKGNDGKIYHTNLKCKADTVARYTDSLFCALCESNRTKEHVLARIECGFLMKAVNRIGQHDLTPLGKWCHQYDVHALEVYDLMMVPDEYLKYLPEDWKERNMHYFDLLNNTDQ
jgi:hypothetical protein